VSLSPVVVSLPIADRRTSFRFYREGLGLDPIGEPAEDGVPEPLQFALNEGVRRGHSECVLSVGTGSEAGVEEFVKRAHQAGAEIVTEPGRQPWGYAGAFADPDGHVWMVTAESLHA
jgi:uncharacterized protein